MKPETLEVPDRVRREIEQLQEEREAWAAVLRKAQQRAERAEAALRELADAASIDPATDASRHLVRRKIVQARAIVEGKDPSSQRLESEPSAVRSANSRPDEPEAA